MGLGGFVVVVFWCVCGFFFYRTTLKCSILKKKKENYCAGEQKASQTEIYAPVARSVFVSSSRLAEVSRAGSVTGRMTRAQVIVLRASGADSA